MGLDKTEKMVYYFEQSVAQNCRKGKGVVKPNQKVVGFNNVGANEVKEVEGKCVNCIYGGE